MSGKKSVGILCGGKSAEHEISLLSAANIFHSIDRELYTPFLIGINKAGKWFFDFNGSGPCEKEKGGFICYSKDPRNVCLDTSSCSEAAFLPDGDGIIFDPQHPEHRKKADVIFPILHGPFGEDGTVQGLLKLSGVPFVGSSVLGSAVGMDKDVMKRLLREGGIPIGKFLVVNSIKSAPRFGEITSVLGAPFFIKPANMGSSVGISKVGSEREYEAALVYAFAYDCKIIIEENIKGREIECSVLGNEEPKASLPGEIKVLRDFYSYEAKYIDSEGAKLVIPAELSAEQTAKIRDLAVKTFQVLDASGLSRVDFFLKDDGTALVNEINTIPGFTASSGYARMWEASGISYRELISALIDFAFKRREKEKAYTERSVFDSITVNRFFRDEIFGADSP